MTPASEQDAQPDAKRASNVPEMSVSELAQSVKKTLESTFGRVRVRGELSRVKVVSSGHMYGGLKDENAVIDIVCWRGQVSRLAVKNPEEGMEVICTGRLSSYPARSNYQLIIESMELAGEGALLKLLEDRRKKLLAEGLFDKELKKPLPFLPDIVGVVTSPTGAVIRDIMHRLDDRFPRHVLLWPARVQGEEAAAEIAAAIRGFDALPEGGKVPRPDVLIVGRGGGSLEDLMAFNEEIVVRAIADCSIPVISAVGHETDTSLSDYAADKRAPTPTGAAEIAVPRRIDLYNTIQDGVRRLVNLVDRSLTTRSERLENLTARLGDPGRLLETQTQTLDHVTHKLVSIVERDLERKTSIVETLDAKLVKPAALVRMKRQTLNNVTQRLASKYEQRLARAERAVNIIQFITPETYKATYLRTRQETLRTLTGQMVTAQKRALKNREEKLAATARMLDNLSYHSVLERGFVVVKDKAGAILTDAAKALKEKRVELLFRGDKTVAAEILPENRSGTSSAPPAKEKEAKKKKGKAGEKSQHRSKNSSKTKSGEKKQQELF